MGCATALVKYIVFLFNLAFVLAAIAFIAIGVVFKLDIDSFTSMLKDIDINFNIAPMLMIIVGCVVFVIAFFGCCGAIRESSCMLTTYAIILLTLFILQVALGVFAFIQFKDSDTDIKQEIREGMQKALDLYKTDDVARDAIDELQSKRQCCGVNGPADWAGWSTIDNRVPPSCCRNKPDICYPSGGDSYQQGCFNPLFDFLKDTIKIVGIVAITIAATELVGAIVALCLSSSIRNNDRRGNYA